ncbi:hypothetical protein GCM10009116_20120 [Brevundimonas basaltis]|uniref:Uncharacterized protein n=1 Tax=Brevundimonas basaltis TaxID=472166 RepID=A0A7W8MG13_9CAUL|nr:hypothetical protein [Brevundimonas basaltis]MBB5291763.1 hypothetical protein [Brevundimonas basaltis]
MNDVASRPNPRSMLIRLGLAILVAALLFGAGYLTRDVPARGAIGEARTAREAAETDLRTRVTANQLLTANVWVYRAAAALDDRNFGVANDAMGEAVAALEAVELPEGDPLQAGVAEALTAAKNLNISVASNLEPQREALLNLARRVTALAEQSQARTDA